MFKPDSLILYVKDVDLSTQFYKQILGKAPLEAYPDFTVFELQESFTLGLQAKNAIDPKPQPSVGGFELCVSDVDRQTVDRLYAQWKKLGVPMALEATELEFGYTFVALDPDGHRLRVCATDTSGMDQL